MRTGTWREKSLLWCVAMGVVAGVSDRTTWFDLPFITFVIVLKADVTRLDDLREVYVKTQFGVLLRDLCSLGLQVASELGRLSTKHNQLIYSRFHSNSKRSFII